MLPHPKTPADGRLQMEQDALYPVLRSMEANGLLAGEVVPSTSAPLRRHYMVSAAGGGMLERPGTWSAIPVTNSMR